MAYAREIFIAIKQKIRFQQADKEVDSHYTVLGNDLRPRGSLLIGIGGNFASEFPPMARFMYNTLYASSTYNESENQEEFRRLYRPLKIKYRPICGSKEETH